MPLLGQDITAASADCERDADLKDADVKTLQLWLETQRHLPHVTDKMLHIFYHSCYFELERTKECVDAYYTMRTNTPEFFANRDVTRPDLVQALQSMYYAVMPTPDPRGYRIICNGLRDVDPAKYVYSVTNKLMLMTIDACQVRYGSESGIVVIHDMKGGRLAHLAKCSPSLHLMRKLTLYNQEGNPVRLKEIHILNVAPWFSKIMAILKPFIKKELLHLIHIYTSDNSDALFEKIPKQYLPKDFGGDGPTLEELHVENTKYLESMRDTFAEEEKAKVDESKREKKNKKGAKHSKPEVAFKRLEID